MVSDRVLDVYPHDQGQHLDEESCTGVVEIFCPSQGTSIVGYRDEGGHPIISKGYKLGDMRVGTVGAYVF